MFKKLNKNSEILEQEPIYRKPLQSVAVLSILFLPPINFSFLFFFTEDVWYKALSYLKELKRIWRMMGRNDMNENVSVIKLCGFCWFSVGRNTLTLFTFRLEITPRSPSEENSHGCMIHSVSAMYISPWPILGLQQYFKNKLKF